MSLISLWMFTVAGFPDWERGDRLSRLQKWTGSAMAFCVKLCLWQHLRCTLSLCFFAMLVLSMLCSCWVPWNCLAAWSWWNCWSASSVVRRVSMSMKTPYKMLWLPSQNGEWWLGEVKDRSVKVQYRPPWLPSKWWVVTWWGERQTGQWRFHTGHRGCLLSGEWWLVEVKDRQLNKSC